MPSSYTGIASNVTPGAAPAGSLPVDADAPNAASVGTPFKSVLDYLAFHNQRLQGIQVSNWTSQSVAATTAGGLAFGNGMYVLSGTGGGAGVIYTSPDLVKWTQRTVPSATGLNLGQVVWSSALSLFCVATFSSGVYTSPDGVTWTFQSIPGASVNSVVATSTRLVGLGSGTGNVVAWYSTNGSTWTSSAFTVASTTFQFGAWDGTNIVVGTNNTTNRIYTSPDGTLGTFTARSWPTATVAMGGVSTVNGQVLAIDLTGHICVSTDHGQTWTQKAALGFTLSVGVFGGAFAYVNGIYILGCAGPGGTLACYSSFDTVNWIPRNGGLLAQTLTGVLGDSTRNVVAVVTGNGWVSVSQYLPNT